MKLDEITNPVSGTKAKLDLETIVSWVLGGIIAVLALFTGVGVIRYLGALLGRVIPGASSFLAGPQGAAATSAAQPAAAATNTGGAVTVWQ